MGIYRSTNQLVSAKNVKSDWQMVGTNIDADESDRGYSKSFKLLAEYMVL